MAWNLAIWALAFTAVLSMIGALARLGSKPGAGYAAGQLQSFLLADEGLKKASVANLLLSTSFSLNGMLYQAWLGYQIGLWALLVQAAWAASYVLLSKHVREIRGERSLHTFLGQKFGVKTQVLAGICSIVGFMVLIGWEFNVGRATFDGLLNASSEGAVSKTLSLTFTIAAVVVCLLYTVLGGLRSNVLANYIQNAVKLGVFAGIIVILAKIAYTTPGSRVAAELFPPYLKVIETLGIVGLISNIVFSLGWQYVDMSTWHSVTASKRAISEDDAKKSLKLGGLLVFIAPGILGTLMGALLGTDNGVDGDNIMFKIVAVLPTDNSALLFGIFSALLASIMSMIDGLLLASAYALVCDIVHRDRTLQEIDAQRERSDVLLGSIRLFLAVVAIAGTLGVYWLLEWSKLSLFDVVYVLIVAQLSLFGPVLIGLGKPRRSEAMHWAIVFGLCVGAMAVALGKSSESLSWALEIAGVSAMAASFAVAWLINKSSRLGNSGVGG